MLDIQRDILPLKDTFYRLALRITLNSQEAEDVVQDVIIKIWKMRSRLEEQYDLNNADGIKNLEAYAMRMVRNLALDRQRLKVNQSENLEGVEVSASPSVERSLEAQERLSSIRTIMQQLPEKQRTVMQLRDFQGYSYKEISDVMQITEDQVKVNLFRARQFVKQKLTQTNL